MAIHNETKLEKVWPRERLSLLIAQFPERHPDFAVFILDIAKPRLEIAKFPDRVIHSYGLPLPYAFGVLQESELFLGVDSCMLHAADLFGFRGVGLLGPTDPRRWGFRFAEHRHIRDRRGLQHISASRVLQALESLLRVTRRRKSKGKKLRCDLSVSKDTGRARRKLNFANQEIGAPRRGLILGGLAVLPAGRESGHDKFLNDVHGGRFSDADQRVFKRQFGAVAILRRVIKVRDAARRQAADDCRIIRLPAAVIAFADHRVGDRVAHALAHRAGSFVKIARVLLQQRWQNRAADKSASDHISVRRAVSPAVSRRALAVSVEIVFRLLHAGDGAGKCKGDRVHARLHASLNFWRDVSGTASGT